jgi:hypothetical protein
MFRKYFDIGQTNEARNAVNNEELTNLYRSYGIIRVVKSRFARHVAGMRERRSAYRILAGRSLGNFIWKAERTVFEFRIQWKTSISGGRYWPHG